MLHNEYTVGHGSRDQQSQLKNPDTTFPLTHKFYLKKQNQTKKGQNSEFFCHYHS